MAVDKEKFKQLARLFSEHATLYAVGGFPRDMLLGFEPRDLDICAELTVDEVENILLSTEFVIVREYKHLGTLCIASGNFAAEYTSFRQDSYASGNGLHRPEDVKFTRDIKQDARRRDFTINAIYYDPLTESFTDPVGGIEDIRKRTIKAADTSEKVFSEDGLRVLRLVRIAAETGFDIDKETFLAAKRYARYVGDIVPERISVELDKIFVADTAYPALNVKDGHVRGFKLLEELGLVEMLFPELAKLEGLSQNKSHHIYDAYRHSVVAYEASNPQTRWAALFHDIGKREAKEKYGTMKGHAELGAELTAGRLKELKMPHKRLRRICDLVYNHMVDLKEDTPKGELRQFIAEHSDIIEDLIALRRADGLATSGVPVGSVRLEEIYQEMLKDGTPMSMRDLPLNGKDAEALGLERHEIGEALRRLWVEAVEDPSLLDGAKAKELLSKIAGEIKERRG